MRKLAYCRGEWERLEDGSRSTFRGTNSSHHRLPWMEAGGSDPVASSYPLFWWIPAVPVFCTEKDGQPRATYVIDSKDFLESCSMNARQYPNAVRGLSRVAGLSLSSRSTARLPEVKYDTASLPSFTVVKTTTLLGVAAQATGGSRRKVPIFSSSSLIRIYLWCHCRRCCGASALFEVASRSSAGGPPLKHAMELLRLLAHDGKHGGGAPSPATRPAATADLCPDNDDGPFFDLDLALPLREDADLHRENRQSSTDADSEDDDGARVFLDGGGSRLRDPVLSLYPSGGLFLKGRLLPLEPSSLGVFAASALPKSTKSQVPAFLLKSAARVRAFKLGCHRRSKSASPELNPAASPVTASTSPRQKHHNNIHVKAIAEEAPPVSLFTRENISRSSSSRSSARIRIDDALPASDEKKLPWDVLRRYLDKLKPLYTRISKRRFSEPLRPVGEGAEADGEDRRRVAESIAASFNGPLKPQDGNTLAGHKVVSRRLRKSRSASTAGRQDDFLMEQQDGIQSAIAHCKRSFNRGTYNSFRVLVAAANPMLLLLEALGSRPASCDPSAGKDSIRTL
ncbi:hypothetical protein GW17_00048730 [Ensete ventricosum]|nr:hypothetical protein GW17_00048730 [Ensete ventricosum]